MTGPKANQNPAITWCTHCSDLEITANQIIFHIFQQKSSGIHTKLAMVNHRCPFSDFYCGEGALVHRLHNIPAYPGMICEHIYIYIYIFFFFFFVNNLNIYALATLLHVLLLKYCNIRYVFLSCVEIKTIIIIIIIMIVNNLFLHIRVIFNYSFTVVRFVEMNFEQFHQQSKPYIAHCSSTFPA